MGDSRRFDLFAKMIAKQFPSRLYKSVADIAGGKGYLQHALRERGYSVTTFDKRNRARKVGKMRYKRRYFSDKIEDEFDLLVGMHPDEATDVIIVEAAKREVPFLVCPCCVKPSAVTYWGKHSYKQWCQHLEKLAKKLGYKTQWLMLPMNGKNKVLVGRP